MRHLILILCILLIGAAPPRGAVPPHISVTADPDNQLVTREMRVLPLHIGGRVKTELPHEALPAGAKSYVHQWPGVYFEAAFKGREFIAKFDDDANEYRFFIDELDPVTLTQPGKSEFRIAGLANRTHHVRLEKVTESIDHVGIFAGFFIPKGARSVPVRARRRQIEFIGDSDMTGYGIRSTTRQCSQEEVRRRSDTQIAYPAKVAKHFNADYQVNAIAGRGMVRNYDGSMPTATMPVVYPNTIPTKTSVYSNRQWQPQIIYVALGSNDFSTALKADEKWETTEDLIADYFDSYERFIRSLYPRNRNASLIIVWSDTSKFTDPAHVAMVEDRRKRLSAAVQLIGFRSVWFTEMPNLGTDLTACDYHWSVNDHNKISNWLISNLEVQSQLW